MKILVIGNSVQESVVRSETGEFRTHTGGVGAIMARELALSEHDLQVTFLTNSPAGNPAQAISAAMEPLGIKTIVTHGKPPQLRPARARIITRNGNHYSANGDWPPMTSMSPEIERLAPQHDWTVITANLPTKDTRTAERLSQHIAVNATTTHHAKNIKTLNHPTVATMNEAEATQLLKTTGAKTGTALREALNAETLMITRGPKGRATHRRGLPPQLDQAPSPPPNTDYIGAGDAATAGLITAIALNLDISATVDDFINNLMLRNAQSYAHTH